MTYPVASRTVAATITASSNTPITIPAIAPPDRPTANNNCVLYYQTMLYFSVGQLTETEREREREREMGERRLDIGRIETESKR